MASSRKKYWVAEIVVEGEIQVRPVPSFWFKKEEGSDVCYWPLKQCGNDEINVYGLVEQRADIDEKWSTVIVKGVLYKSGIIKKGDREYKCALQMLT